MRKTIFLTAAVLVSISAVNMAAAQQSYTYSVSRTRTLLIDWEPEEKTYQRYTVSVSPLRLISNGLKFDLEYELPKSGHWVGTSLAVYLAPQRRTSDYGDYWDTDGNDRSWFNSGWDSYHRMWGLGTSAFFKNTFSRHGWYYSAGLVLEFFRVGVTGNIYVPYKEDGLTFYDYGRELRTESYFKPTAQINIGKHIAISERCYFDLYAGLGLSYAFDSTGTDRSRQDHLFSLLAGFAYRGLTPVGGFRFGVLLWKPLQ